MKVEIEAKCRPCIVSFGEGSNSSEEYEALFHFWAMKQHPKSAVLVGEVGGQVSYPVGVVEYEDGTVHEVRPKNIRFVDDACSEYWLGDGK